MSGGQSVPTNTPPYPDNLRNVGGQGVYIRTGLKIRTVKDGRDLLEKDLVLRCIVEVIVREIDPDRIVLFGSRARGDYTEGSDYDLLVLKEGVKPKERAFLNLKLKR